MTDGDVCRVGVAPPPSSACHRRDPLRTTVGDRLAAATPKIADGAQGRSVLRNLEFDDQGLSIDPDGDEPCAIDLLLRPYFLTSWEIGDEVADATGRAWSLLGPWNWQPFDTGSGIVPAWPLTLLHRSGPVDRGSPPCG